MTSTPVTVAGLPCSRYTIDELVALVAGRLERGADGPALSLLCVNAHIFNLAWQDPALHRRLRAADVLALDGMSMVWACRRAGATDVQRCNMTEALRAFLDARAVPPSRVLLIGLDAASVQRAARTIDARRGPARVAGAMDGYRDLATYRRVVATHRYDLVLVGCGTPRSEEIVEALAATGGAAVVWHVGGGTLHFLAGNAREAPAWMRRTGTQWLHRLATQPRTLWRRYLVGNPLFVWRVLRSEREGR